MFGEFRAFLEKYGVIGLAVAVIMGGKLNEFVSSLVNDLFMPVVFQPLLSAARVDDVRALQFHGIRYGKVIGSAVDFLIVALVVFLFARHVLGEREVAKR